MTALRAEPAAMREQPAIAGTFHTLVVQPTTLCNLDCAYCYLPDRKRQRLMTLDVASACAAGIAAQDHPAGVDVVWHGGEPTATPLAHFRALLEPFEELRTAGLVRHAIQTNATLVTPGWCELLAERDFQVGVSIDGPAWANDERRDRGGHQTFERTMRGVELLREAGIPFSVICVVTPSTIARVDELAEFFEHLGCASVGFNIEEQEGGSRPLVDEHAAYAFWRRLLQRRAAGSELPIRDLDRLGEYLAGARAGRHEVRPYEPIPTVAHNGNTVLLSPELLGVTDLAYEHFLAGNVLTAPLPKMLATADGLRYVAEFKRGLRACAESCGFFDFCQGAQAGNRYFEHGSFAATETAYCRATRQALVRAAADELNERR